MRTTLETEARAIRKLLAQKILLLAAVEKASLPSITGSPELLDSIQKTINSVLQIDREADEENDRHIDGRDEF